MYHIVLCVITKTWSFAPIYLIYFLFSSRLVLPLCILITILNGLRAIRDSFARGHSGERTNGEARGSCATVPEGIKITYCAQAIKYYFYYKFFYDIKVHPQTYETRIKFTSPYVDLRTGSFSYISFIKHSNMY